MITNNLETGHILDKRYKVVKTLGEGGYGVVYEAVNIHSGLKVAIKENRNADERLFMREARVLHDFSDEKAIVSVMDTFKEEEKAYIVMEFVEGESLHRFIGARGKLNTEEAVHKFIPIMEALERIHKAGYIHRDINYENIMVQPDGSLKLLDFGSAREIEDTSFTRKIGQEYFAPIEQRLSDGELGPFTDIYSLCASIYYCITGVEPRSADFIEKYGLKRPSDFGADIYPQAEKVLMKGMALLPPDRYQSVTDLKNDFLSIYPDLSEEEKLYRQKQTRKRRQIAIGLIMSIMLVISIFAYLHRTEIRFLFIETEKIALLKGDLTEDEQQETSSVIKHRLDLLCGKKNYLWNEDDDWVYIEMPLSSLYDEDPEIFVPCVLTHPMKPYFTVMDDESGSGRPLGSFSQDNDFKNVEIIDNEICISFMDEAAKRFDNALDSADIPVDIIFDEETGYKYTLKYNAFTVGDGSTIRISETDVDFVLPGELTMSYLTDEPFAKHFPKYGTEWQIHWEETDDTALLGSYQCNENDFNDESTLFRFNSVYSQENNELQGYDADTIEFQAVMKNRLDAIGVPYAFGIYKYNDTQYVIKVPRDSFYDEELKWIGKGLNLGLGSRLALWKHHIVDSVEVIDTETGFVLKTGFRSYNDISECFNILQANGLDEICLYLGYRPVAKADLGLALEEYQNNGSISFTEWICDVPKAMDRETRFMADFISVGFETGTRTEYTLDQTHDIDRFGNTLFSAQGDNQPPSFFTNSKYNVVINLKPDFEANRYVNHLLLVNSYDGSDTDPLTEEYETFMKNDPYWNTFQKE